jgi:hypothetical protein
MSFGVVDCLGVSLGDLTVVNLGGRPRSILVNEEAHIFECTVEFVSYVELERTTVSILGSPYVCRTIIESG